MPDVPLEAVGCPFCGRADPGRPFATGSDYEYATTSQVFRFLRCAACDLLYLSPRPRAEALGALYPPDYYSFGDERDGGGLVRVLRRRWELRKVGEYTRWIGPGPRKILDVGCGRGSLLSLFRGVGGQAWELHGIDLAPDAVDAARAAGFLASRCSIEEFEPQARFDLIVLQQVIEHVAEPHRVMEKLARLLVPGGAVVLETPNLAGWDFGLFRRGLWGGYHFPRHWTLFSRRALRRLAENAGLVVTAQRSLLSLSFWSWSVHHVLLRQRLPRPLIRLARPPSLPLLLLSAPLEILQRLLGRDTSNQRLVAVKPGV